MKHITKTALATTTAALAVLAGQPTAHAQSADTLIDKLVEKGVLTTKEAKELRQEANKDFTKAFAAKTGMPNWVNSWKLGGDFRGRSEQNNAENPLYSDRNRFRYRLRLGMTANMFDDLEVGVRLGSGNPANSGNFAQGGSTISANTDLGNGNSRKFLWVEAAYGKWTPVHTADWTISGMVGKFDFPLALSPMIWDADLQPEGTAIQITRNLNSDHALKFNGMFNALGEFNQGGANVPPGGQPSRDPYLLAGQLLWEGKWTPKLDTVLGVSVFNIVNKDGLAFVSASPNSVPNPNAGNSHITPAAVGASTGLRYNFNPVVVNSAITYKLESFPLYKGEFPVKLAGEFMKNPAAAKNNEGWNTGLTFGKAGHKGLWELSYRYQVLRADAWYSQFADDDNGAFYQGSPANQLAGSGIGGNQNWSGGTNVKGHWVKGTYSLTDSLNLSVMYYLNELIINSPGAPRSTSGHLFVDLMWKF